MQVNIAFDEIGLNIDAPYTRNYYEFVLIHLLMIRYKSIQPIHLSPLKQIM